MLIFQTIFRSSILESLSQCESEEERKKILDNLETSMSEFCDETAESLLRTIKTGGLSAYQGEKRQELGGFEERLQKLWSEPLDLLELLIWLALEAGREFNYSFRKDSANAGDAVFGALIHLHARACQISSAIVVLLKSGFADDAHARWRSLHEISVISSFISQQGQEVAERFLLHRAIQQYKQVVEQRRFQGRTNEEPISQEDFDNLRTLRDSLVDRFGSPFKEDYGWAADAIGVARPTIWALEREVDLDHFRPCYKMASDNIHANSHGTLHRLGKYSDQEEVLLAGPSNAGLAGPGHSTAISLCQATSTLLLTRLSIDTMVDSVLLGKLAIEIGDSFLHAQQQFEAIA
ncbi:MAG: DUF5677 domain-containing protein [Caldilineaceae bacterium]|nr:DUF5677 domain-containing protein [Caldilineaceae bacterium]